MYTVADLLAQLELPVGAGWIARPTGPIDAFLPAQENLAKSNKFDPWDS